MNRVHLRLNARRLLHMLNDSDVQRRPADRLNGDLWVPALAKRRLHWPQLDAHIRGSQLVNAPGIWHFISVAENAEPVAGVRPAHLQSVPAARRGAQRDQHIIRQVDGTLAIDHIALGIRQA